MAGSVLPTQNLIPVANTAPIIPRAGKKQEGTPYTQLQWQRMQQQQQEIARKAAEADKPNLGERLQAVDDEMEGNLALGRIGKNYPKDTRAASVLLALGIMPDIMKAIIASGQLPPHANR